MVVTVNSCCCCFSLRTGTIIIGVVAIVSSSLSLLQALLLLTGFDDEVEDDEIVDPEDKEILQKLKTAISIITLIVALTHLIFYSLLVHGARREKPHLIKIWIYYSIVSLSFSVIVLLICIVVMFMFADATVGISMLVSTILMALVGTYVIIVVNSYHRQLLRGDLPLMIPAKM